MAKKNPPDKTDQSEHPSGQSNIGNDGAHVHDTGVADADDHPLRAAFFADATNVREWLKLFDHLPNVYLYVKNRQGQFVGGNQQWLEMRQVRQASEIYGMTDADVHPLFYARQYQDEDRKVMESNQSLPNQVWLVPSEPGRLASFVSSKIPIHDDEGTVIGIAGVMYKLNPDDKQIAEDDPVMQATEIIGNDFRSPLEINQIAEQVDLSVSQLNRLFRKRYQIAPSEYLQRVRIHEACSQLASTTTAIGEVALACGFYDQAHLSRTFRKRMGMTPKEFRDSEAGKI